MEFGFYRPRLRSPADISSLQSKYAFVNETNRRTDESPLDARSSIRSTASERSRALSELDDDVAAIKSNRDAVAHNRRPCRALTHDFTHSLRQHNSHLYSSALCFLLTLNATHAVPSTGFQNDNSTLYYYTPFTRYNLLSNRFDNRLYRVNGALRIKS